MLDNCVRVPVCACVCLCFCVCVCARVYECVVILAVAEERNRK